MGTTAASDARTAISVCTAHNMDNIDPLNQSYLNTYMSLVPDNTTTPTAGTDASGSKYMQLRTGSTSIIDYWYRRGDVVLYGEIDLTTGTTTWSTNLTVLNRFNSLAQGLKVTGAGTTTPTAGNPAAAVGTLGCSGSVAWSGTGTPAK